ncbi:MAG: glycosyltransferase family 2 protein [Acidimicrobiia bacterium]
MTLNFNGGALTVDCLEHLRTTDWPDDRLELVVVDNGSNDGVVDLVRSRWPEVRVVASATNRGFAGGMNLGLDRLDDIDYVALVNNDLTVDDGWLAPLVDTLESDPTLGAACPKILFATRFLEVEIETSTSRRGRGDHRALGVRITGIEIGGGDVIGGVQWWQGFWGPEASSPSDPVSQWSSGHAVLRVPIGLDAPVPPTLRVRIQGATAGTAVLRAGGAPKTLHLTTEPAWCEVDIGDEPIEVINNAGSVLNADGYGADRGYLARDDGTFDTPADVFAWCGAAAVLSTRYLSDIGLFDERLFLYYEDLELSWRGRDRGWRYRYVPDVVVRHVHSATTGEHSQLARYQNERNHLLVLALHAPPRTLLRAAGRSLLVTASYARRDLLSPALRGDRPSAGIVRDRVRAFGGFLRLLPAIARERGRTRTETRTAGRV